MSGIIAAESDPFIEDKFDMLVVSLEVWMLLFGVAGIVLVGIIIGLRVRRHPAGSPTLKEPEEPENGTDSTGSRREE